jgi:hypothetical protein
VPVPDSSDLYGLSLDRFVAERDALAKKLRGEGNKEEASRVAALRKPSVAVWTVNQIVRTQGSFLAALFDAGDELQRAQSDLLAGRGAAGALREASRREREAVAELTEVARGLLSADGHEPTQATLDRVGETLRAAAQSEDARGEVVGGCLARELRQVGFDAGGAGLAGLAGGGGSGLGGGGSGGAGVGAGARPDGGAEAGGRAEAAERRRVERAERERAAAVERERAEALKSARRAEAAARRLAEQAARQAGTAQERRDRAAEALREADEALAAARDQAVAAAAALRQAQETVAEL